MTKYWWVNHKQTFNHEINGGYVWAPKVKRNGRPSHFYDNLRIASPGDIVISFANAAVSYVGLVVDYAISSPKPDSFGNAGEAWLDDGWMLPVSWHAVDVPFKPSLFIDRLPGLLRTKYAPIRAENGHGNQGAYLSEVDRNLLEFVLQTSAPRLDLDALLSNLRSEMHDTAAEIDEIVEQHLLVSKSLSETDKTQLIKARRGQGIFRANVQQHEFACRVTGVQSGFLLIASHIKPWRSCVNSDERLDGNNGLLLTPHVDRLFDRGYITFNNAGCVILSSKIGATNISRLGISENYFEEIPFGLAKRKYLDYHRENVFLG
jgi:hypothetical protein